MKLIDSSTGIPISGYCSKVLLAGRPVLTEEELQLLGLSLYGSYINAHRDKKLAVVTQATLENPDADLKLIEVTEQYIVVSEGENEV